MTADPLVTAAKENERRFFGLIVVAAVLVALVRNGGSAVLQQGRGYTALEVGAAVITLGVALPMAVPLRWRLWAETAMAPLLCALGVLFSLSVSNGLLAFELAGLFGVSMGMIGRTLWLISERRGRRVLIGYGAVMVSVYLCMCGVLTYVAIWVAAMSEVLALLAGLFFAAAVAVLVATLGPGLGSQDPDRLY
jgi:hypothetical protein